MQGDHGAGANAGRERRHQDVDERASAAPPRRLRRVSGLAGGLASARRWPPRPLAAYVPVLGLPIPLKDTAWNLRNRYRNSGGLASKRNGDSRVSRAGACNHTLRTNNGDFLIA